MAFCNRAIGFIFRDTTLSTVTHVRRTGMFGCLNIRLLTTKLVFTLKFRVSW